MGFMPEPNLDLPECGMQLAALLTIGLSLVLRSFSILMLLCFSFFERGTLRQCCLVERLLLHAGNVIAEEFPPGLDCGDSMFQLWHGPNSPFGEFIRC